MIIGLLIFCYLAGAIIFGAAVMVWLDDADESVILVAVIWPVVLPLLIVTHVMCWAMTSLYRVMRRIIAQNPQKD